MSLMELEIHTYVFFSSLELNPLTLTILDFFNTGYKKAVIVPLLPASCWMGDTSITACGSGEKWSSY